MRLLRQRPDRELTNGPAKLAQALAIDKGLNGVPLFEHRQQIWLEEGLQIVEEQIEKGPRIGLGSTPEPWYSIPWRYWLQGNPFVSR